MSLRKIAEQLMAGSENMHEYAERLKRLFTKVLGVNAPTISVQDEMILIDGGSLAIMPATVTVSSIAGDRESVGWELSEAGTLRGRSGDPDSPDANKIMDSIRFDDVAKGALDAWVSDIADKHIEEAGLSSEYGERTSSVRTAEQNLEADLEDAAAGFRKAVDTVKWASDTLRETKSLESERYAELAEKMKGWLDEFLRVTGFTHTAARTEAETYWVVRDEATGTVTGVHAGSEYRSVDEVYEEYRHLPDHFTVEEIPAKSLTPQMRRMLS